MKRTAILISALLITGHAFPQLPGGKKNPTQPQAAAYMAPHTLLLSGNMLSYSILNGDGKTDEYVLLKASGTRVDSVARSYARYKYEYSANGRSVTVKNHLNQLKYEFSYDASNRLTESISYGEEYKDLTKQVFTYGPGGLLISEETFKRRQTGKDRYAIQPFSKITYLYDEQKRLSSKREKNLETSYTYKTVDGNLLVTRSTEISGNTLTVSSLYDPSGNLLKIVTESTALQPPGIEEFVRDKKGNTSAVYKTAANIRSPLRGYFYLYADGSVSSPEKTKLTSVDTSARSKSFTRLRGNFTSAEGFIKDGMLNGPGRLFEAGIVRSGNFLNNKLNGFGSVQETLRPEDYTVGQYKDDQLNGFGFKVSGDKITAIGIYEKDRLIKDLGQDFEAKKKPDEYCSGNCTDGFGSKADAEGQYFGFFKQGKLTGPFIRVNKNRTILKGCIEENAIFYDGQHKGGYYLGYAQCSTTMLLFIEQENRQYAGEFKNGQYLLPYPIKLK